jgi:hypothetical protein
VEKIVGDPPNEEFKARWKGYGEKDDEWKKADEITGNYRYTERERARALDIIYIAERGKRESARARVHVCLHAYKWAKT